MTLAGAELGGRYVLDEQIGNGGYGEVWRATDTVLARPVAIKLLHPRYARRSVGLARFRAEARQAGGLSHENIAQVFDYGEPADGQPPYLVMELVDGSSLEAALAGAPLEPGRTMDIVAQAAAGLQAAHAAGMIHRDIKPGNLLLAPGGTVKITDFGIAHTIGSAQVTASGELIGTPGYLAPERAGGEQATPASDLYSLGMVAYECLAGAAPFTGTALEVALAHRDRPLPPLPPSVSADVCAFVMRLTLKDPARRLGNAAEVAVWAGLLRDGVGVAAPQTRPGPAPGLPLAAGWLQRRTVLTYAFVAVTALVVVVLASVIGFAATSGPVTASPVSPVSSRPAQDGAGAPAGHSPVTNPGRPPAADPATRREPLSAIPDAKAVNPVHGHGHGRDNGGGHANGPGEGNGNGQGKGNGNGPGD
ncbi:MAG TPA: serine/threonine-protein kinase [Streptosporangiaceae bacterium]|nr:serine/threonine-protein kinase [Streptosporangiaceae bacterium]